MIPRIAAGTAVSTLIAFPGLAHLTGLTAPEQRALLHQGLLTAVITVTAAIAWTIAGALAACETSASRAARRYHGRYITTGDLDPAAAALVARAQRAADTIVAASIHRDGLLDDPASGFELAQPAAARVPRNGSII
jgi:hypothetical protein